MFNLNDSHFSHEADSRLSFAEKLILYPALCYVVFEMIPQVCAFFWCGGAR